MKLKQALVYTLITGILLTGTITYAAQKRENVPSSFLYNAINKYKQKNYTGCIQDMDYIIQKGRPSDLVYYYKAISYAQLGMQTEARQAYESAAAITSNRILKDYANQAMMCIDDPTTCDSNLDENDITSFIKSEKFMHPEVKETVQKQAIERAREQINDEIQPGYDTVKYINMSQNGPTDKEIADAVRTLAKLGINPLGMSNPALMTGANAELAQINALLGGNNNNNNNIMNLMPIINAMQTSGQGRNSGMSKEFIQTYMMNQMLPNFSFGSDDK